MKHGGCRVDEQCAAVTNISTRGNVVTIINVFTVEPAKQDALVTLLTRATDETVRWQVYFDT